MIKKCYYYCSYQDSPKGYETAVAERSSKDKLFNQTSLKKKDEAYLSALYHNDGNIKLYKDSSSGDVIFIVRHIDKLIADSSSFDDKYISIMFCGDSEREMSYLALATILNPIKVITYLYESVIIKANNQVNCSYTIDSSKISQLESYAETIPQKISVNELSLLDRFIAFFSKTTDVNTAVYYLSKVPNFSNYTNNTVFKVPEKAKNSDVISIFQVLKHHTLNVPLKSIVKKTK